MQTFSEILYELSARLSRLCFDLDYLRKHPQVRIDDEIYKNISDVEDAAIAVSRGLETRLSVIRNKNSVKKLDAMMQDVGRLIGNLKRLSDALKTFNKIHDGQLVGLALLEIAQDHFAIAIINFEKQAKYYNRENFIRVEEAEKFKFGNDFNTPHGALGSKRSTNGIMTFESVLNFESPMSVLIPIFFATDRDLEQGAMPPLVSFKNGRGSGVLTYGVAEVSIPPGHKIGRMERPAIWKFQFTEDIEKHVVVTSCEVKDFASWKSTATDRIMKTKSNSALVFIHGYNNSFDDAIRRAAQIGLDLEFDGLILAYSWCSEAQVLNYPADEDNIKLTEPLLMNFLKMLRDELKVNTIHVIAHSMGNRALVEGLSAMPYQGVGAPLLNEVIMAAPDIDAERFKLAVSGLSGKAFRYTLYGSEKDKALKNSKKYRNGYPRAGDGGDNILVVNGVDTVDASALGEDLLGFDHTYFATKRTMLSDLSDLIRRSVSPDGRFGMRTAMKGGIKYWLFKP